MVRILVALLVTGLLMHIILKDPHYVYRASALLTIYVAEIINVFAYISLAFEGKKTPFRIISGIVVLLACFVTESFIGPAFSQTSFSGFYNTLRYAHLTFDLGALYSFLLEKICYTAIVLLCWPLISSRLAINGIIYILSILIALANHEQFRYLGTIIAGYNGKVFSIRDFSILVEFNSLNWYAGSTTVFIISSLLLRFKYEDLLVSFLTTQFSTILGLASVVISNPNILSFIYRISGKRWEWLLHKDTSINIGLFVCLFLLIACVAFLDDLTKLLSLSPPLLAPENKIPSTNLKSKKKSKSKKQKVD